MALELLALAVIGVFVADVFLYYRWKTLNDELQERQRAKSMKHMKDHVSKFSWEEAGTEAHGGEDGQGGSGKGRGGKGPGSRRATHPLVAEADRSLDALREIDSQQLPLLQSRVASASDAAFIYSHPKPVKIKANVERQEQSIPAAPSIEEQPSLEENQGETQGREPIKFFFD